MSRNKYPDQTVERIIDVSTKLFLEKGYDNTSLQDIINELGNLTKGAIYHHFNSKEEIFNAVAQKLSEGTKDYFINIMNDESLNGVEKLKKAILTNIENITNKRLINATPNLLDNPKLLANQLREIEDTITPKFIVPIIEIGIKDKSIKTDKPNELAEVLTIMINIWINPVILGSNTETIKNKCHIINEFTSIYGFILFDESTISKISKIKK